MEIDKEEVRVELRRHPEARCLLEGMPPVHQQEMVNAVFYVVKRYERQGAARGKKAMMERVKRAEGKLRATRFQLESLLAKLDQLYVSLEGE